MRSIRALALPCLALALAALSCGGTQPGTPGAAEYDVLIRGGTVYDGSGGPPFTGDVALSGDTIAAIGDLAAAQARTVIDARGMAVAPGFINTLSWSVDSLVADGRSQSDIRQGVTLEVLGEGSSMGPLSEPLRAYYQEHQGDIRYDIEWTTLGEYLEWLVGRGLSTNVASFVGASTVRAHVLGLGDRDPSPEELARMQELVAGAMREGALGVSSALIYPPGSFAEADELTALARVAAEHGGIYITHMRSEGNRLLEAIDETLGIARASGARAEIYHLKAAGRNNWHKLDQAIARIEEARAAGLAITADMYTYTAGATGLSASMPPWVQEGGHDAWMKRMRDPAVRERLRREMTTPSDDWENWLMMAGSADNVLFLQFDSEALRPLTGKTLAEVAAARGTSPADTAIDLILEDDSRIETVYFVMSEDNLAKKIRLPWMSFCSDAASQAPEGVFLRAKPHPRAYGSFARLLGRYVRDENVISLAEAVRRLTTLPAENLALKRRGRLVEGFFADVVVFDPAAITDRATYADPHQYAEGVVHVFVNGEQVLRGGEHTGARPGRVVRGPGWSGWSSAGSSR